MRICHEYDDNGNEQSCYYLNAKGESCIQTNGVARIDYTYDSQGNITSITNKNTNGKPMALNGIAKEERTFASLIIAGTISHIDEIDKLIENHLSASWSMDRISRVALAILRTSVYEILFQNGAETKIVIDEAVNIAKDFDTDDSYKFINAVLDKIGKDEAKRA